MPNQTKPNQTLPCNINHPDDIGSTTHQQKLYWPNRLSVINQTKPNQTKTIKLNVLRHHRNQHIANSKFEKAFSTAIAFSLSNGLADTNEAFFKTLEEKLECLLEDTQNIRVFV